jgi:hypothetical protein
VSVLIFQGHLSYTKYMLLSRHQNAGQNHVIKIADRCFENVAQFTYLGITISNRNLIQEDIEFGQYLLPFSAKPSVFSAIV